MSQDPTTSTSTGATEQDSHAPAPATQRSITVYGTGWCPDVRRSRALLDADAIGYTYVDVDEDEAGADIVRELQGGARRIPTIVLPDASFLVEPSDEALRAALDRIS